jgi:multimeric flavodoxin WrbA
LSLIKLLSISGSPVEGSSTDILLKRVADSLASTVDEETTVERIRLNDLKFIPCQACGRAPTPQYCFYDDDLTRVYESLEKCDCLIFGSPVYFDSVSGQAKMFIDRCNCFRPYDFNNIDPDHDFVKLLKRKRPGAMVLIGGERQWMEGARRVVAGFFKWVEVTNEGLVTYSSTDDRKIGTVAEDSSKLQEADDLGRKLATQLIAAKE